MKVGETFTVYTTYRSNTTSILWTIPYDYVDPVGYVGPVATSVTFRAKKAIPSGVIIQATTHVNYGSIDYVDDWLVRITDNEPGPDPDPDPDRRSSILPWMTTLWQLPNIVHKRYIFHKKAVSLPPCCDEKSYK